MSPAVAWTLLVAGSLAAGGVLVVAVSLSGDTRISTTPDCVHVDGPLGRPDAISEVALAKGVPVEIERPDGPHRILVESDGPQLVREGVSGKMLGYQSYGCGGGVDVVTPDANGTLQVSVWDLA